MLRISLIRLITMAVGCVYVVFRILSFSLLLNPTTSACGLQYGFDKCPGNVLKPFMDFTRQFYLPNCLELLSTSNFDSRRAAQRFSRTRTPQTLWIKHGHLCLWLPNNLLYHDLELNPGPSQKKPMCANCSKAVRKTKAAILCKDCASYFHVFWADKGCFHQTQTQYFNRAVGLFGLQFATE